jgi:hypothetical protein
MPQKRKQRRGASVLVERCHNGSLVFLRDRVAHDDEVKMTVGMFYRIRKAFGGHNVVSGQLEHGLASEKKRRIVRDRENSGLTIIHVRQQDFDEIIAKRVGALKTYLT